jgi:hypothetical protein
LDENLSPSDPVVVRRAAGEGFGTSFSTSVHAITISLRFSYLAAYSGPLSPLSLLNLYI